MLRQAGRALRSAARECDFVARCGGDEFALLLPQTTAAGGLAQADRLRRTIAETSFTSAGLAVSVQLSAGVAELSPDEPAEMLVRQADAALYEAKAAGRNRAVVRSCSAPDCGLT